MNDWYGNWSNASGAQGSWTKVPPLAARPRPPPRDLGVRGASIVLCGLLFLCLATQYMSSNWADEMQGDKAGMLVCALNFTTILDDEQAVARNRLLSGNEEVTATPGQR